MCNFVSLICTKDRIYLGKTDSHEDTIAQHGLVEGVRGTNIVRVELIPQLDGSLQWIVDQDILPDWWDGEKYEARCRAAVEESGILPLYADYEAKRAPLCADYKAKHDSLYADYKAKNDSLYADYDAKRTEISERIY